MSQERPGPPIVRIMDGPCQSLKGPVVGIDRANNTVRVRLPRFGVMFGRKQTTVEIDVRRVRRLVR